MVEIVVPFTDGYESSYGMVARGMLVVKRSLPEPVSEGVDTKRGLQQNLCQAPLLQRWGSNLRGGQNISATRCRKCFPRLLARHCVDTPSRLACLLSLF